MGLLKRFGGLFAGRKRQEPHRETEVYPRLQQLGLSWHRKAQMKASPPNIRYFTRSPYVRRAINCIREPITALEWEIVPLKGVKLNNELERQIQIATDCFSHPNNFCTWDTFIGQIVEDMLTFGGGCIEQQLGGDPVRPLWLYPVDAQSIQIYPGWQGGKNEPRYMQNIGYSNVGLLMGETLTNDELIYIKINDSTETPYGFGFVEIAFNEINRLLCTGEYAGNVAGNAVPSVVLQFPGADNDWLRSYRQYWQNEVEGQGKMPLIGGKEDAKAIQLHTAKDDALYLGYQEFMIKTVFTTFGLSPQNAGLERDVNRSTAEVAEDRDHDQAVKPIASKIASHLTHDALHALLGFYSLRFRFPTLVQEDEEALAKIYDIEYKNNAVTPNEYRARRGMEPLDSQWGDMVAADVAIATMAARGSAVIDDKALASDQANKPKSKAKQSAKPAKLTNKSTKDD